MTADHVRIRRQKDLARYDQATIHAILDADCIAHVGFSAPDGRPFVVPMLYARDGDALILHGSVASRLQLELARGIPVCVCVTLADGIQLARSAFNHSFLYRSVMAFGTALVVGDDDAKRAALDHLMQHILPGRLEDARGPTTRELNATTVLKMAIEDAAAKVSDGAPDDKPEDVGLPIWAGNIPIRRVAGAPVPAPDLPDGIAEPEYARDYHGPAIDPAR